MTYKSARRTTTGTVLSERVFVVGIYLRGDEQSGAETLVTLRDGGASGDTLFQAGISDAQGVYVSIPNHGLPFDTDVHATLSEAGEVVVVYRSRRKQG